MKNKMKKCLSMFLMLSMLVPMLITGVWAEDPLAQSSELPAPDSAVKPADGFSEVGSYSTRYDASNPPAIDGTFDEWYNYSWMIFPNQLANFVSETDLDFLPYIGVVKTSDYFYLYGMFYDPITVATTETDVTESEGFIFNGDSVRFAFDLNGVFAANYPKSQYAPGYTISFGDVEGSPALSVYHSVGNKVGSIDANVLSAVEYDAEHWTFELAIPTELIINDFNDALYEHGDFAHRISSYAYLNNAKILFSYIDKEVVSYEPAAAYSTVSNAAAADPTSTGLYIGEAGISYSTLNCANHEYSDAYVLTETAISMNAPKFATKNFQVQKKCKYCDAISTEKTRETPKFKEILLNAEFYAPTIDGDFEEWEARYVDITDDSIADNEFVMNSVLTFPIRLAMAHTKDGAPTDNLIISGVFEDKNLKCSTADEEPNYDPMGVNEFDEEIIDNEKLAASNVWSGDTAVFYFDFEGKAHGVSITRAPLFYAVTPVQTEDGLTLRIFRGASFTTPKDDEGKSLPQELNYAEVTDRCTFKVVKTEAGGWQFEIAFPFYEMMKDDIYNMQVYNKLATPSPYIDVISKTASYMMLTYYDKNVEGTLFGQYSTIKCSTGSNTMKGIYTHEAGIKLTFSDCLSHIPDGNRVRIVPSTCGQRGYTAERCILCHSPCNIEYDDESEMPPHTPGEWDFNECNASRKRSRAYGWSTYWGAYWDRYCVVCGAHLDEIYQPRTWKEVGKIYARGNAATIDGSFDEWNNQTKITTYNTYNASTTNIPYPEMDDEYIQFKYDDENLYMYGRFMFATREYTRKEDPDEQIEMEKFNPSTAFDYKQGTGKTEYTEQVWNGDCAVFYFDLLNFAITNWRNGKGTPKGPKYSFTAFEDADGNLELRVFRVAYRYDLTTNYHEIVEEGRHYGDKASQYFNPSGDISDIFIGKAARVAPEGESLTGGWEFEVAMPWSELIEDNNYSSMNVGGWVDARDEDDPVTLESIMETIEKEKIAFSVLETRYDVTDASVPRWGMWGTEGKDYIDQNGNDLCGNNTGLAEAGIHVQFTDCDHSNVDNWVHISDPTYAKEGVDQNVCPDCKEILKEKHTACLELPFKDVVADAWYEQAVKVAADKGVLNGIADDVFGVNTNMTREMFVQMIAKMTLYNEYDFDSEYAFDPAEYTNKTSFADVRIGEWYSEAIEWAYTFKLCYGVGDNNFGIGQPITRAQLAMFMMTYARFLKYDVAPEISADDEGDLHYNIEDYSDFGDVPSWALDAMSWAVANGLITGTGDKILSPNMIATRTQVAQIIMRFMENYPVKRGPYNIPLLGIPAQTET